MVPCQLACVGQKCLFVSFSQTGKEGAVLEMRFGMFVVCHETGGNRSSD